MAHIQGMQVQRSTGAALRFRATFWVEPEGIVFTGVISDAETPLALVDGELDQTGQPPDEAVHAAMSDYIGRMGPKPRQC